MAKRQLGYHAWRKLVAEVLANRGTVCHLCGAGGATSADHLIPASHGGPDEYWNLAPVHVRCNTQRGNRAIRRSPRSREW